MIRRPVLPVLVAVFTALSPSIALSQRGGGNAADSIKYKYASTPQLDALKAEAAKEIDAKAKMIQEMVDQVFSFGELGMQEFETSKYLTGILEQNGFKVERGVAGIPTAFVATMGLGQAGHLARLATSTTSRRRRTSPASATTIRSSPARPVTAKATTRACRSTSPPRSS